ncbi:MAG: helix-turn-helix transcriptional regulator [Clostridiaceae bacterium]|nr:helix-turn-helix transcriptional regulator [Clostridiaceae bacterium]NLZ56413.1 helix-turn-helix transcriptional regulator [Clostridiaceae bacterium]
MAEKKKEASVFSYNKLWKLLIDHNMKKSDLKRAIDVAPTTMARMSKNMPVSMPVLGKICKVLNCNIGDIVDYIPENQR